MKKRAILLVLAMVVAGGIFAQEQAEENSETTSAAQEKSINNWISGEVSIFGAGVRYERMLTDRMSIGANAYYSTLIFWNEIEIGASFRYYVWKEHFYLGSGLGFHMHNGLHRYSYRTGPQAQWQSASTWGWNYGVAISPEAGFRIDFGAKKGGFFIEPGIKFPITFGVFRPSSLWWWGGSYNTYEMKSRFAVGFGVVPYIGLGFAF